MENDLQLPAMLQLLHVLVANLNSIKFTLYFMTIVSAYITFYSDSISWTIFPSQRNQIPSTLFSVGAKELPQIKTRYRREIRRKTSQTRDLLQFPCYLFLIIVTMFKAADNVWHPEQSTDRPHSATPGLGRFPSDLTVDTSAVDQSLARGGF